jgi:hypothetical protein
MGEEGKGFLLYHATFALERLIMAINAHAVFSNMRGLYHSEAAHEKRTKTPTTSCHGRAHELSG